jgi:hypothetical protein
MDDAPLNGRGGRLRPVLHAACPPAELADINE